MARRRTYRKSDPSALVQKNVQPNFARERCELIQSSKTSMDVMQENSRRKSESNYVGDFVAVTETVNKRTRPRLAGGAACSIVDAVVATLFSWTT